MDLLLEHLGKGIFYIILISMPIVLTAAGLGLIVGILQAVTQVQEQTIAAAPKILGVFLVILLGGTVIIRILNNYTTDAIKLALEVIPSDGVYVIPPKGMETPESKTKKFFNDKAFIRRKDKPGISEMIKKPVDSPFLKNDTPKQGEVFTPAPPLANPTISEEIDNYKNMQNAPKELRTMPSVDQKAPVIPPISRPKTNAKISLLPDLDEPPAVDSSDLPKIAIDSSSSLSGLTGAAANTSLDNVDYSSSKKKNSTIIINDSNDTITYKNKIVNNTTKTKGRGSIILESE